MKTASVIEKWKSGRLPSGEKFGHVLTIRWVSCLKEAHSSIYCRCSAAQNSEVQWQLIHQVARDSPRADTCPSWPQHQVQCPDCPEDQEKPDWKSQASFLTGALSVFLKM